MGRGTSTLKQPFGRPDAGRSDPYEEHGDALDDFIPIASAEAGGLAMESDTRRVRTIVGRKGAGKTLYLRRLHASAKKEPSLYTDDIQQSHPATDEIARVCEWYQASIVVQKWMSIWKMATLRSVVSHLLRSKELSKLHIDHRDQFESGFSNLYGTTRTPTSIYGEVRRIINDPKIKNEMDLDRYLADPAWEELEYMIGDALRQVPPLCFYIDAIDDEFRHAPMFWLQCQKGLFYQVMKFLNDTRLGNRLHITICIRDIVYSSILGTEHGPRHKNREYIRILDWDRHAVSEFMRAKLARLPQQAYASVNDWLEISELTNGRKPPSMEDIEPYLLRHTRLIPRDVIIMGNELCLEMSRRGFLTGYEIRKVVRAVAADFGRAQLNVCANHIGSDLMPRQAAQLGYSEIYTGTAKGFEGGDAYLNGIVDDLISLITEIGADRFGRDRFLRFKEKADEHFECYADPVTALWQNGLIGYMDGPVRTGRPVFYASGQEDSLKPPLGKRGYALHPMLNDCLQLSAGRGEAVLP